jgi:23S rRNA (cytosine1962-C5)-methyltransferase
MYSYQVGLLESPHWKDYVLLDSGDGLKLERFGPYIFLRPESQAIWRRTLPQSEWEQADAIFQSTGEESGGHWEIKKQLSEKWVMSYPLTKRTGDGREEQGRDLRFWAMTTAGRHLGVFPEGAAHWDWFSSLISNRQVQQKMHEIRNVENSWINVLNLFGYTGLATLSAAAAGAKVTHVDASKKSVSWARENQELSGLKEMPIRWIVEDAHKYVLREAKRGVKYDGIILEPPKFGRGPKGEIWEVNKSLRALLNTCHACLSNKPLFVVITLYAVRASAIHLAQVLQDMMSGKGGRIECGELVLREQSAGRLLSQAVYARWNIE